MALPFQCRRIGILQTLAPAAIKMLAFSLLLLYFSQICDGASPYQCPSCGNATVPFPLSTDPSCGRPDYAIMCRQGNLELQALNGRYSIQRIDRESRNIVISSMPLAPASCTTLDAINPSPASGGSGGLALNQSQAFNVTSSNTILFLNCSSILLRSPLNCSSSSVCHRYIDSTPSASACRGDNLCCSFTAGGSSTSHTIRTRTDGLGCSAYVSVVRMDQSLDPRQWSYGVELGWAPPRELQCGGEGDDCDTEDSSCRMDSTSGDFRCLCDPGYVWNSDEGVCSSTACNGAGCSRSNNAILIAGLASGGAVLAAILATALFVVHKRRSRRAMKRANRAQELALIMSNAGGGKTSRIFTAGEMKRATNNFSKERLLGTGGFGEVYKGTLDDGVVVAIKLAKLGNIKGRDQVINEVRVLSQVNHRNLVRIWGCCVDTGEPLVVYEYIPNGTLYEWLHVGRGFLDWRSRLRIALQTAEGLAYLHSAAYPPIYHRDVKSSNILLDNSLVARVCDFGLSRLAEPDLSHVSTCAQGTLGYLDPEYYRKYQLTDKSDVYSFGVVLLELVTSQKAIDFSRDQDDINLAMYVIARTERGDVMDVVDKRLLDFHNGDNAFEVVTRETIVGVVMLALNCLRESKDERPTMKEVSDELNYIIETYDTAEVYKF
ncbi:wall-associated receptor kinase-like 20 [Selaginella moellendorffii]|uniref:wall-associated receptor kinase-like 20 n=1 Tax=Selaginella moellendorffii TaxID=88036 RepID=UPI000D1D07EE|nr:wall-associated receptor kinase-like 20 [Selaginella moellendorffii]|eukprot:XP_024543084.1 wall-associated receptor kinase-like 20 [Selaginella moellendorffii]